MRLPRPASGAVTPYHIRGSQDDMVGFRVKIPILGDITLGLWFGDHRTEHDPPAFAYAANTAFLQAWSCMRSVCGIAVWTEPTPASPVLTAIASRMCITAPPLVQPIQPERRASRPMPFHVLKLMVILLK